jgi:predicted heme/steroid binding protein/uncharacterized membrane protein
MPADAPQAQRHFTQEELAQFDGKEGRAAYVAYKGKVYDVTASKLWRNGKHVNAHFAGNDLTANMPAAPHDEDVMERFAVVGLVLQERERPSGTPRWALLILDRHPHPISVHFPIGLGLVAALFQFLALFVGAELAATFRAVAFWNLVICAVGTPPAIATGTLSWIYNYSMIWTPIYRWKVGLSAALVVLAAAALAVHLAALGGGVTDGGWYWIYTALVLLLGPTVVLLGYFGGKITFPS